MHRFNQNLPYANEIVQEKKVYVSEIEDTIDILEKTPEKLTSFAIAKVRFYLKLKHSLDDDLFIRFMRGIEKSVFESHLSLEMQSKCLQTASQLARHHWKRNRNQTLINLDWQLPYKMLNNRYFCKTRAIPDAGRNVLKAHEDQLIKYIAQARRYFGASSGDQIVKKILPQLKLTENVSCFTALGQLTLFLPSVYDPTRWIDSWIAIWKQITHCNEWDRHWLFLFARAVKNYPQYDWKPNMPFLFGRIQAALRLPAGEGLHPENRTWPSQMQVFHRDLPSAVSSAAKLSVYLLLDPVAVAQLDQLLRALNTLYHPSNSGKYTSRLGNFLLGLTKHLSKRIGRQEFPGYQDIMENLLELATYAMYSKNLRLVQDASRTIQVLSSISPEFVASRLLERVTMALNPEISYQSHLAPVSLRVLTSILHSLTYPSPVISGFLPQVLQLTVSGIDANDLRKTMLTISFYSEILDRIPLINESVRIPAEDRESMLRIPVVLYRTKLIRDSEYREDARRATVILEDWALEFLDRLMKLIQATKSSEHSFMTEFITEIVPKFFGQMSDSLYANALRRTKEFVFSTYLPSKEMGYLISSCVRGNPTLGIAAFIPTVIEALKADLSESEISYQLRILFNAVACSGSAILPYQSDIINVINQFASRDSKPIRKLACKLIRHVSYALVAIYPLERRSLNPKDWNECVKNGTCYEMWGHAYTWDQLEINWHIPSPDEYAFGSEIIQSHVLSPIADIEELMKNECLSLDQWRPVLRRILYTLRGISSALPAEGSTVVATGSKFNNEWNSLRTKLVETCRLLGEFWMTHDETASSAKCLKLLLELIQLLLCRAGEPSSKTSSLTWLIYKHKKNALLDYPSSSKAKSMGVIGNGREWISRSLMVDRVAMMHATRLSESSYSTPKDGKFDGLVHVIFKLTMHNFSTVRTQSTRLLGDVLRRYKSLVFSHLDRLVENLSSTNIAKEVAYGTLSTLSQRRVYGAIFSQFDVFLRFILNLCNSDKMIESLEVDQRENVHELIQIVFTWFNLYWMLPPQAEINIIGELSRDLNNYHWRYQLLRLSCLSWFILPCRTSKDLWKAYLYAISSDVAPIRRYGLYCLSRLLAAVKGIPVDAYILQAVKEKVPVFCTIMRDDHKLAQVSVDGESNKSAPCWSEGVSESLTSVSTFSKAYPNTRAMSPSPNFSIIHAQFVKGLYQVLGVDAFVAMKPVLDDFSQTQTQERRVSLCSLSEIVAGMCRGGDAQCWKIAMPLLQVVLPTVSLEWTPEWVAAIRFLAYRRTYDQLSPLVSYFVQSLEKSFTREEFSSEARWLKLIQGILIEWAGHPSTADSFNTLAATILSILIPVLAHPYKLCREEIGRVLFLISNHQREPLQLELVKTETLFAEKDKQDAQLRETMCYFVSHSVLAGDTAKHAMQLCELLPVLFYTQSHPDLDLATLATFTVGVVAQGARFYHHDVIQRLVDTVERILQASKWHSRAAGVKYISAFLAHHRAVVDQATRRRLYGQIVALLQDDHPKVETLARTALSGFFSGETDDVVKEFGDEFLKISARMSSAKARRKLKRLRAGDDVEAYEKANKKAIEDQKIGAWGLSSIVRAFPYTIPPFLPDVLMELALHAHSPSAIQKVVHETFADFKRTHQDNWQQHKEKFTIDQLDVLSELLISPHYYA